MRLHVAGEPKSTRKVPHVSQLFKFQGRVGYPRRCREHRLTPYVNNVHSFMQYPSTPRDLSVYNA